MALRRRAGNRRDHDAAVRRGTSYASPQCLCPSSACAGAVAATGWTLDGVDEDLSFALLLPLWSCAFASSASTAASTCAIVFSVLVRTSVGLSGAPVLASGF